MFLSSPSSLICNHTFYKGSLGIACRFYSNPASVIKRKDYPPNSSLEISAVHNRNPRNLEKLRIATKPTGWWLDNPGRCFWNKVTLEISTKHITAKGTHFFGYIPVTASTTEWCIQKYLYSTRDTTAAETVGRVFAQRCIEAGILELYCGFSEEDRKKQKVGSFIKGLEEAGLLLKEPDQIHRSDHLNYPFSMDRPWEFHEDLESNEIRQETPTGTDCGWKTKPKGPKSAVREPS